MAPYIKDNKEDGESSGVEMDMLSAEDSDSSDAADSSSEGDCMMLNSRTKTPSESTKTTKAGGKKKSGPLIVDITE